jgi:P27 family predicted phage terminase small subunit
VAVKIAQGTYRADRDGDAIVPAGLPPKPAWLCPVASAEWDRVVGDLVAYVGLSPDDAGTLALCCQAYADFVKFHALGQAEPVIESHTGALYPSPYVGLANKARDSYLRYSQVLGLSPAARTGLHVRKRSETQTVEARKRG